MIITTKEPLKDEKKRWPTQWLSSWRGTPEHTTGCDLAGKGRSRIRLGIWILVNIIATVSIVFTNKSIFANGSFGNCQIAFACYHFFVTALVLWFVSRPWCGVFSAKRIPVHQTLHLAVLMALQVILQNLSLAYSSVIFYQLARLLLTPLTALLNFLLYRATIPRASIVPLTMLCAGVGIVSFYESLSKTHSKLTASFQGTAFAFTGVVASSLYTAFIGHYHRKFQMSSVQLLFNQAPMSAVVLLLAVPFFESPLTDVVLSGSLWVSILASGVLACLVNLSQFFIIEAVGPVSSTVIGHLKTCIIIGLGWIWNDRPISRESIIGIFMALAGMTLYMSIVLQRGK